MEEVARKERLADEISQEEIAFEFPKLTTLRMQLLPKLKSFYKGRHCVKWPKLKKLGVLFCSMLEVFHIRTTSSEEATIFLPKEILSNLETMFITLKEAEMLKLCIKNYRMSCLKKFTLLRCPPVETLHCFLSRMPYLEELTLLADDKLREVIPSGSHMTQENIGNVAPLKSLKLSGLSDLKEVGFERDPVLQWLENLSIKECGKLVNLAPPSVTLAHLTSLKVRKCRGLENLMGFSIAKSLAQLTSFKVVECTMLEKIVAEQNGEDKITSRQEIVFSKLKTLELVDLPALCCFCNFEMHAFKFPSLEKLIVRDCSNMTKFSVQVTTPINLQVLKSKEEEENWYWKGDLNATILQMFLHSLQSLELSNYAELEEIWLGKISPANNSFQKLTTLVVKNCEFLSTVIPSYLLPYLENLEELHVERCGSVEVIFDGSDMVMKKSHLKRLILCQLPKMKHVWNKNLEGILSYENLEVVAVTKCQCLYVLFPAVPLAKNLSKLETLKIIHCGALVDIVGNADEIYEARAIEQFLIKKELLNNLSSHVYEH
ncbi:uncharacterized protein LOC129318262 isoform X2 [Prosopis cineraria]|uniref:uncharacterized protein LOC129318262 isoform X2 n=1 Tax=Prosopis cineraria TaxID=364024 RepID=UPI00240EF223|nr:uncharacterized protein LOC129318262 isoform X2 [Prosopis cineraria]